MIKQKEGKQLDHKQLKEFPNDFLWSSASAAYQVEGA
ncbi:family 1 glycosylhydrolase, partial [Pseudomonas monteilii]|nr:family 1 glycosylhydrolase [Pseudomonas monteilii]